MRPWYLSQTQEQSIGGTKHCIVDWTWKVRSISVRSLQFYIVIGVVSPIQKSPVSSMLPSSRIGTTFYYLHRLHHLHPYLLPSDRLEWFHLHRLNHRHQSLSHLVRTSRQFISISKTIIITVRICWVSIQSNLVPIWDSIIVSVYIVDQSRLIFPICNTIIVRQIAGVCTERFLLTIG